ADDMGLGKTVQVLALLAQLRAAQSDPTRRRNEVPGPALVVAPRSLLDNWLREAARFCPELTATLFFGPQRHLTFAAELESGFAESDIVLTTYGTLRRDIETLRDIRFRYAILDEAQAIKNDHAQVSKAVRLLQADHRLVLTGTPLENHLGEVWSLFEFLNPGMLGRSRVFKELAKSSATAGAPGAGEFVAELGRALRPFLLRRTKEQVLSDLPEKSEQVLHVELPAAQRRQYDELRAYYRETLLGKLTDADLEGGGLGGNEMSVLEALLRLRQAACHPGLLAPEHKAADCGKFASLLPMLEELMEGRHKALVFSQFTSLLALLKPHLDARGIDYEYLDGKTRNRQARVDRFQEDPQCRVFLISLKAGGVGLNLTAADYVFLLDPWWNPAVESQAIDRTHRIGQTQRVFAYRLIAKDTVEERVAELQEEKRALADAVLAGGGGLAGLTARDVARLLE
ncbi:MAG: DEAD/DEAH box helicase, partial [Planctomycetes bacterium]|nr:DEAD/DEAH box helicase [Planctomycetota bacterium]